MRRRQYNESKDGGNGFLGLGRKDRGDSPKFKKSIARLSEVDGGAPLDEVVVTADAPRWLKYQRQYETDNPKEDFLRKNITNFDRKFGNSERNYPKRMDRQYNKRANDYVAEQLRAEYESKNGTRDNSRLRTAEERLKLYDYYNDKEREILKNSKISSWYLPAERQHRIRVSDNPDDYLTESFIKTDSQGNDVFDSESGNRKGYQRLSNQLEGTPERFRVFSNAQNDIEDYVNPGIWLGNMARNLGQAPYKAMKTGSALPIIGALAEPLLSGIPLTTIGGKAKKAVGENRVDAITDLFKNLKKEVDPRFKEPRQAALDGANRTQYKYYNSDGFNRRLEKLKAEQKREFRNAITNNILKRGSDLDDLKQVMDTGEIGDYIMHNLSPVDKWDVIQRNAENKKYLAFFESKKNRIKNFKENKPPALNYDEGYQKGRAGGMSGWNLDSNLDPHVRHNLVDGRLSTEDISRIVFHEGNHGLTNGNALLNKQTKDLLQSPFDLTDVHPRKGNDYVNRKSYILDPTEIYARIQEMRLHSSHGDFQGLNQYDKINLKTRAYGPQNNKLESSIDPLFWDSIKDWDKFFDVMNKMPSVVGAGLGLHALQNQNPEQFKKGGVVGGGDDPKKPKPTYQDSLVAYNNDINFDKEFAAYVKNNPNASNSDIERQRVILTKKYPLNNVSPQKTTSLETAPTIYKSPNGYSVKDQMVFKKPVGSSNEVSTPNSKGQRLVTELVQKTVLHGENARNFIQEDGLPESIFSGAYKVTYSKPARYGTKINQIPTLDSEIKYSRDNNIATFEHSTPSSKYQDGVLKQDFKGIPGVQVWSKRDKETGTLRPVALVNSAGESIDYNKYKDGAFPEGFQHPKKYADGGFINNNMTDPNNYLMAMLTRLQNGRADSIVPPIPSLPIKPIDPTIKPNWPPGNEVPNNPDQPYRPKVSQPQAIAPRPVNPLVIPSRTQDVPNTDNVQYNLPNNNPKPKDPLLGGLLVGAGAAGGTMANIGRPDVGLGTLSGVATGAGYGAMLGPVGAAVGGILGGIGGFASTGLNRTRYDEANAEAQKGKIKAATIYGGDVGSFEFGGNVYSADGEEIVPIQTEKGEKIVSPEGYIYTSKAKQLHKHMDNDLVTDILPSGSYVASNSRAMQILRDKANKMVMGYDTVEYLEGGGSPIPKEHTLGEIMGKNKMTPAEILDIVKNKFPTNQIEYDQFAQKANVLNLKSRLPYINAVISAAKK